MNELPSRRRSRAAEAFSAAAGQGRFELQVCPQCGTTQYPPRDACVNCLDTALEWRAQTGSGELIAHTMLQHSHAPYFRARLPWRMGMIQLDCGPTVLAHVAGDVASPPARVCVHARVDKAGGGVLVAGAAEGELKMSRDTQLSELTCDPRGRAVLIARGRSPLGAALVRAFADTDAGVIWAVDGRSWSDVVAEYGNRIDIVVNNLATEDVDSPEAAIRANYLEPLEFMRAVRPNLAWVNVLSVFAFGGGKTNGALAASMSAARSAAVQLRAQMRGSGVRVLNAYPGPSSHSTPAAVARSIIAALEDGVEDILPDSFAQDWHARWRANPEGFERELEEVQ